MKAFVIVSALALMAGSVAGCNSLQTFANVSGKIAAASPTVIQDLNAAGLLAGTVATQIAAANPNSPKIQAAVAKVQSGVALTSKDAAALAPAVQLANGSIQAVAAVPTP